MITVPIKVDHYNMANSGSENAKMDVDFGNPNVTCLDLDDDDDDIVVKDRKIHLKSRSKGKMTVGQKTSKAKISLEPARLERQRLLEENIKVRIEWSFAWSDLG